MSDRRFPIIGGASIPWALIAPHEARARTNHDQTLERLAERGGLSACEAIAVLDERRWRTMSSPDAELSERVSIFENAARTEEIAKLRAELGATVKERDEARSIVKDLLNAGMLNDEHLCLTCERLYQVPKGAPAECPSCALEDARQEIANLAALAQALVRQYVGACEECDALPTHQALSKASSGLVCAAHATGRITRPLPIVAELVDALDAMKAK
jgi:rubrerythrin